MVTPILGRGASSTFSNRIHHRGIIRRGLAAVAGDQLAVPADQAWTFHSGASPAVAASLAVKRRGRRRPWAPSRTSGPRHKVSAELRDFAFVIEFQRLKFRRESSSANPWTRYFARSASSASNRGVDHPAAHRCVSGSQVHRLFEQPLPASAISAATAVVMRITASREPEAHETSRSNRAITS